MRTCRRSFAACECCGRLGPAGLFSLTEVGARLLMLNKGSSASLTNYLAKESALVDVILCAARLILGKCTVDK